jgi:hypothetical protein
MNKKTFKIPLYVDTSQFTETEDGYFSDTADVCGSFTMSKCVGCPYRTNCEAIIQ